MLKSINPLTLDEFKKNFDSQFKIFLNKKIKIIQKDLNISRVNVLLNYIHTISSAGKRFRPYLLYISYTEYGGKKDISEFLFGIELLHIFALVHDDIMDKSVARHGIKTSHSEFEKYYDKNSNHIAMSQAILLGDLIFSLAEECLLQNSSLVSKKNISKALSEYRTLVNEVIYGQMADIDMTENTPTSKKDIYKKMILKSGRYSIMRPLIIGAHLAGAAFKDIDFLSVFGENVGVAFQIQDDILDCTAEDKVFGKKKFGDIMSSQQTYISYYMFNKANLTEKNIFLKYYGNKNKLTLLDEKKISGALVTSGALDFTRKEADRHFLLAEKSIADYNQKNIILWKNILQTIRGRRK